MKDVPARDTFPAPPLQTSTVSCVSMLQRYLRREHVSKLTPNRLIE